MDEPSPSLPEAARLALVHLVDRRGGGEQGVVRGVEGRRAAVPRVHRQGAGPVLQSLNAGGTGRRESWVNTRETTVMLL